MTFFSSCKKENNQNDLVKLSERIVELEKENKKLKDSIEKNTERLKQSFHLVAIPYVDSFKVGRKDSIAMLIHPFVTDYPIFEIYKIVEGKEIKIGEDNKSSFTINHTPEDIQDNDPEYLVRFPDKEEKYNVDIYGKLNLNVEE